jgi:hypothetical protein
MFARVLGEYVNREKGVKRETEAGAVGNETHNRGAVSLCVCVGSRRR